jgi:hypothetical protein
MHRPEGSFPGDDPSPRPTGEVSHAPSVEFRDVPPPSGTGGNQGALDDATKREQTRGHWGLIGGLVVIFAGIAMIFGGVTGSVDLVFESGGTSLHIATAVIGVVVCVIGLAVIIVTEPKVKYFFAKKV